MIVGINQRNEIVQVGTITDTSLTQIDIANELCTVEDYQSLTDFKLILDGNGSAVGRSARGFKGEMENLWNARKELAVANQKIADLQTQLETTQEALDFLIMGGTV